MRVLVLAAVRSVFVAAESEDGRLRTIVDLEEDLSEGDCEDRKTFHDEGYELWRWEQSKVS